MPSDAYAISSARQRIFRALIAGTVWRTVRRISQYPRYSLALIHRRTSTIGTLSITTAYTPTVRERQAIASAAVNVSAPVLSISKSESCSVARLPSLKQKSKLLFTKNEIKKSPKPSFVIGFGLFYLCFTDLLIPFFEASCLYNSR